MSHFSRIQTQIKDKQFLLMALDDLGYQYSEGNLSVRGFGGQKSPAQIVIHLPMSYDIGFVSHGNTFQIVADWMGVIGMDRSKFVQQLLQRYAYHAAKSNLEAQGFTMIEEKQEDGAIRILLRRTR